MTYWLKEADTCPGNAAAFEETKNFIPCGNAIAFVGAGASAPLYPVWSPFLNGMLENAIAKGLEAASAFRLRPQLHRPLFLTEELCKANEAEFYNFISETFGTDRPEPIHSKTHEALMRLPFLAYVTTNFDVGLEHARRLVYPQLTSYNDMSAHQTEAEDRWRGAGGAAFSSRRKEVLHLHGRFNERDGIVLTMGHYQRAYRMGHKRILNSLGSAVVSF